MQQTASESTKQKVDVYMCQIVKIVELRRFRASSKSSHLMAVKVAANNSYGALT